MVASRRKAHYLFEFCFLGPSPLAHVVLKPHGTGGLPAFRL